MKVKFSVFLIFSALIITKLHAQDNGIEYFVTTNANLHIPFADGDKGAYPILWYDKKSDPKLQIGGFGLGFTAIKPYRKKSVIKAQANLSRHVYWDNSFEAVGLQNQSLGSYSTSSVDYTMGIAGTIHFMLSEKFSVGTGLGCQVMLWSFTRLNELPLNESSDRRARNNYYKRIIPTLPVEFSLKKSRTLYTIRYEQALLNRYKKDIAAVKKEGYGLISFEVGFRMN
jgi:hypothetical protein